MITLRTSSSFKKCEYFAEFRCLCNLQQAGVGGGISQASQECSVATAPALFSPLHWLLGPGPGSAKAFVISMLYLWEGP